MNKIEILEQEVEKIKNRNKKVETDKAWETSLTRRAFIALSTYILVVIIFYVIGIQKPFLNAIIPAIAYFVSTASLGLLKEIWIKRNK